MNAQLRADAFSEPKALRTTLPASLLSQWWTLGAITADRRTTGRHAKVAWVIIDRYMKDKGNGRASVRYIGVACGLSKSIVMKACRELVDWGYFSQRIGVGTRPTEFTPKWSCVPPVVNAVHDETSVPQAYDTSVPPDSDASKFSVPHGSNESYLPYPADKSGLRVSRNMIEAAPLAPPTAGPSATEAVTASGGFEGFWSIWPRKHGKAAARIAYGKIDSALYDTILAAAQAWAGHYSVHAVEKKWIPEPANWLTKERWDEDLPIIHDDAKGAAITKAKANASVSKVAETKLPVVDFALMTGLVGPFSDFGTFHAEIVRTDVRRSGSGTEILRLEMEWDNGRDGTWHEFCLQSPNEENQKRGEAMLASITYAIGLGSINDSDELLRRTFVCTIGKDRDIIAIKYSPLPANDNSQEEAA